MNRLRDLFPLLQSLPPTVHELGLSFDSQPDALSHLHDPSVYEDLVAAGVSYLLDNEQLPLRTLLPALAPLAGSDVSGLRSNRARNALRRDAIRTWGDLGSLTPRQVRLMPYVGELTVDDILRTCVEASLRPSTGPAPHDIPEAGLPVSALSASPVATVPPQTERLVELLSLVAAWAMRERALPRLGDLLRLDPDGGELPGSLRASWNELVALAPEVFADRAVADAPLDELLEAMFGELAPTHRRVFELRVLAGPSKTLEEIGNEVGVTRERIRQVQVRVEAQVAELLRARRYQPLVWRASDLRAVLGLAAPADDEDTVTALEWCLRGVDEEARTLCRQMLLFIAGPYRERAGWLELVDAPSVNPQELIALADEYGLLAVATAHEWLTDKGVDPAFHDAWIDRTGKFRRLGDRLAVWTGSLVEKSVALLAHHATPLSVEQLMKEIGEDHNVRSARARFFEDTRFMRINRSQWALRSWELEEYTGITDEIAQRIEAAGGRAELAALIEDIPSRFNVRASSVRAYAEAPMFVLEAGFVRLRRDDEPFPITGHISHCKGAYLSAVEQLSLVLPVNKETMRGSGRTAAPAIAHVLGVSPGRPRTWRWTEGELSVTWPRTAALGPSIGSIRALARSVDAAEGESIRLDFDLSAGTVHCERIPADLFSMPPKAAVELLTGLDLDNTDPVTAVAAALRVSASEVRHCLTQRGDDIIDSLLTRAGTRPSQEP